MKTWLLTHQLTALIRMLRLDLSSFGVFQLRLIHKLTIHLTINDRLHKKSRIVEENASYQIKVDREPHLILFSYNLYYYR